MRVFLDANVLFSAAKSDGAVRELLRRLQTAGLAGFECHRRDAGPGGGITQRARPARVVQYQHAAKALDKFPDFRIAQVGAQLRQVGAAQRAGMHVDQSIAVADDAVEQ